MLIETIKILMIDDDEEDFMITKHLFSGIDFDKYSFEWVSSYDQGKKCILEKNHDIYLIDYRLGPDNGLELIREILEKDCDCPMILLTGQNDIEVDRKAMKLGASDYLIKGSISAELLERSIRYSINQTKKIYEIKLLNNDLEKRVIARTQILNETIEELEKTKSDLNLALEKEKDLNELKSRFVTMASHEFRTPLSTILSSLSLIKTYGEMNNREKQDGHIVKIQSSVKNLTELLDDFLSLGKLEEGVITANCEEFDVKLFLSEISSEMQSTIKNEQKINYTHNGSEIVLLDKKILKNILYNLSSNAIKFSPNGETIEIISERKNASLEISIKDNGIGISKADQEHLFQRFFRGRNAEQIQGTGLGLHIVSKYVELLNGDIRVSSEENNGTTFRLVFPQ